MVTFNWSLAHAQQQSSLGIPQSSTSMRGSKVTPKDRFLFNVIKCYVSDSSCESLVNMPLLGTRT